MKKQGKKIKTSFRAKHFLVTLNESEKLSTLLAKLREYLPDYMIASEERAPSTGHIHNHVYIHFEKKVSIKLADFMGAHVDCCKGSPQQNIDYVSKEGKIVLEEGKKPHKGGYSIKDVMDMNREQRLDLPFLYLDKVLRLNAIEDSLIKLDNWHKEIEVLYIWGESGIGKSLRAYNECKNRGYSAFNVVKYVQPFWHGVTESCECCCYDDWRDSHMPISEFINFIDYNVHSLNVKNGTILNKYKFIVLTTVQDPKLIYPNVAEEPRKQWYRRIKFLHLVKLNGNENYAEAFVQSELDI